MWRKSAWGDFADRLLAVDHLPQGGGLDTATKKKHFI
jgi:hypothetical protein